MPDKTKNTKECSSFPKLVTKRYLTWMDNEHSYTLPNAGSHRQTQAKAGDEPTSQVFPPDNSKDVEAEKSILDCLGTKHLI